MKYLFILYAAVCVVACRPSLKIQKTQETITRTDTSKVLVADSSNRVDSAKLISEIYRKVLTNKIDFNTFSAKVKVDYQTKDASDNATAYIRIQKDSIIWMSLRGALGIEGARVLITRDSIVILNVLKKEMLRRRIDYLTEVAKLPFDFGTLQDLIIGNPVYIDSNITAYQTNASNQLEVKMTGRVFEHLATLDNTDFKILHSMLQDVKAAPPRMCEISFSGYETSTGVPFATKRIITISEKSTLKIDLEYKTYSFNQPVTFPFEVTNEYKEMK